MESNNRVFTGIWIPKDIYLNKDVKWISKILFLEIHSFTANGKPCFMSNEHISRFLGVSVRQVTRLITELKNIGWIEETSFDGRKRFLKSKMRIDFNSGNAELTSTSNQHRNTSPFSLDENVYDTNTIKNNNYSLIEKKELVKPKLTVKQRRNQVIK